MRNKLNARLHQLLAQNHYDYDERKLLAKQVSNNRTIRVRDLTESELKEAITLLTNMRSQSIKKMQAKAINKAKELGIISEKNGKMDWTGLNTFCEKTFKKKFYELQFNDLRNCITGLENWQKSKIEKSIKNLLTNNEDVPFNNLINH